MLKIKAIFFIICLMYANNLLANHFDHRFQKAFNVQRLSIEQGLSQSVVYDITQDIEGYIWIATEDGLNRFNGYDFEIFEHKHSDPNSLHENLIYTLLNDSNKGLWLGTQNGLSYFDYKTQAFTNYSDSAKKKGINLAGVTTLANVGKYELFIGSENGLFLFDKRTNQISMYQSPNGFLIKEEVVSFDQTKTHLWLATNKCIYSININNHEIVNHCTGILQSLLMDRSLKVLLVKNQHLWIGTNNGLIDYDMFNQKSELYLNDNNNPNSLSANWIQDLAFNSKGELWVATDEGANLFNIDKVQFKHFNHMVHDSDGLSSNDIYKIFIDSTGLIWLGTYTGGLNILDLQQTHFKHLLTKSDLAQFNTTNTIHGITKDKQENLWIASFGGGLIKLDMMTGEITRPLHDELTKSNKNYAYTYSLLVDYNQQLWVGTTEGLLLYDLDAKKLHNLTIYINNEQKNFNDYVFQIYQDHNGKKWLATTSGLYFVEKFIVEENKTKVFLNDKLLQLPQFFLERSSWITTLLETFDGNIWVGGPSGLLMYSINEQQWFEYTYQADNPQSLSYNDVQVLFEDSRGILWVGTAHGLNKVVREKDNEVYFERITKEQGLSNNVIYGILEDKMDQLWLSTNLGLIQYSKQNGKMRAFNRQDGLSSNEFNKSAYYSDEEGVLYFGSINGITLVDETTNDFHPRETNLKITDLTVGERDIDIHSLNRMDEPEIVKLVGEDVINLSIADLFYRNLGAQNYRYRLIGLGDDWVDIAKERRIILANLQQGNYRLEIQSRLNDESWPDNSYQLKIKVESSFWQSDFSVVFICVLVCILIMLIIYYIRAYYIKSLLKTEARLRIKDMHLKESRDENIDLKKELSDKLIEFILIQKKHNEAEKKLSTQAFREPISGFYYYKNIANLLKNTENNEQMHSYNLVMLFQLNEYKQIINSHGLISAAEVLDYIASQLRKYASSDAQIASLADDAFLILANTVQHKKLTSALLNLQEKIIRTQIPIANGLSINCGLSISYLEIYPDNLTESDNIIRLTNIIIKLHQLYNSMTPSAVMRVDLNEKLESYFEQTSLSPMNNKSAYVKELVDSNRITLHYL